MGDDTSDDASNTELTGNPSPEDQQRQLRQRSVREKLQQMYGDDSAETVRRFLHDLTGGGEADEVDVDDDGDVVH